MNPQVDAQAVSQECTELDIAIVGGAMAGATLALGLADLARKLSRPLKIAVIEAFDPAKQHPGFDARSIAIANGSVFELKRLGIWPLLEDLGTAITDIHVSDRGHFGMTELNAGQFALDSLGQVVELERVGQRLFGAIGNSDIQLYCPARLEKLQTSAAGHSLTLSNGQRLSCRLLLAADGVNSSVRAQQQQALQQFEFGQSAVIANVATDKPHNGMAWERFTEHGPLHCCLWVTATARPGSLWCGPCPMKRPSGCRLCRRLSFCSSCSRPSAIEPGVLWLWVSATATH